MEREDLLLLYTSRDLKEIFEVIQQTLPGRLYKGDDAGDDKFFICARIGTDVVVAVCRWETVELLQKENETLRKRLKCYFPDLQRCTTDPKGLEEWLRECEKELREEYRLLETLYKVICQAIRMIVLCMGIVSNCGKRTCLRNRCEKVVILILWRCGDIESNPGPPIADITRDFCKKMISLLVIKYWERKEGRELSQADYKRKPGRWPEHVWFGDPSTCKNETRNTMLRHLHDTCLEEEVEVPNQWLTLTEKYQTLQSNGCHRSQKKQYADDLYSWLCQLRSFETADQLFERLSDITDQERNCILEHMFKKMKQYVPDLTSKSIQSRRIGHESTISQMSCETSETAIDTVLVEKGSSECAEPIGVFINIEDNGKGEIPEALRDACYNTSDEDESNIFTQETHTSSITDSGDLERFVDLFGDGPSNLNVNRTSKLAGNNTVEWEIDVTNNNQGSKRKLDLTGYQGQHIPSKRQNTSPESNVLLLTNRVNDVLDEDRETTLADLIEIVQSEMKTNTDDNCVPGWNECAQGSIVSDTKTTTLMQELEGYLSDEFINELSKQDSQPYLTVNN